MGSGKSDFVVRILILVLFVPGGSMLLGPETDPDGSISHGETLL